MKKPRQAVVVTLSGKRKIEEVARDLKAIGLDEAQSLDAIGVVTGATDPDKIAKLRKVPGVQDVSLDHKVDIGPPDGRVS
ncbi:hypothetical protein [Bradyrhizobium guangzhouense]|uniref:Ketohydroxyglutarate aldolase n=1 Tax=Bradyrhizobium guangzhouense TaxID=1325095 RepID=A0AAE5X1Z0_9BRAD|nr:hypothetical protein [Bradyrhizobium guangzhouense]QAU47326.1 hypothetical protein XH91_19515 [Bradyrhizobium guangzhouense]RXH08192.1 hypothetical protein EAS56_29705 [Bradyrhizobium guangzhouense]RXH14749.1 hypothetical protein EAS54_20440 [Bradyrhizobium guangzhouense]